MQHDVGPTMGHLCANTDFITHQILETDHDSENMGNLNIVNDR